VIDETLGDVTPTLRWTGVMDDEEDEDQDSNTTGGIKAVYKEHSCS
jgi:hypothetical protein